MGDLGEIDTVMEAVRDLLDDELRDGSGRAVSTLLVYGAPCTGKTTLGLRALRAALERWGDGRAFMTVQGRTIADGLNLGLIRQLGASSQTRPVATLSALAFRMIMAESSRTGGAVPRLLNGAEQGAVLRQVLGVHVAHARTGDLCDTCGLLTEYFSSRSWADVVCPVSGDGEGVFAAHTSDDLLSRGVNGEFIGQLRDMLARMDELGVRDGDEESIIAVLGGDDGRDGIRRARLASQWRLAFALRREYADEVRRVYPRQRRLDASRLMVEGAAAVERVADDDVPDVVIIDDAQDLTLAGMDFLRAMADRGCRLLVLGDPDESVQSFRGSYPEYLFRRISGSAVVMRLDHGMDVSVSDASSGTAPDYRELVAARVSLDIPALEDTDVSPTRRPWKMPAWNGANPIRACEPGHGGGPHAGDGTVLTAQYRDSNAEMDDVVWSIRRAHIDGGLEWNDMALIAHDNGTVRAFGERLRREGVPVRYSSITRPLKDEPFVRGLFALIELADMRERGLRALASSGMGGRALADAARSRAYVALRSPLFMAHEVRDVRPVRLNVIDTAMETVESLSRVVDSADGAEPVAAGVEDSAFSGLTSAWDALADRVFGGGSDRYADVSVDVDDSLIDGVDQSIPRFDADALMLMLVDGGDAAVAAIDAVRRVRGGRGNADDPDIRAFRTLWDVVGRIHDEVGRLQDRSARYVLWAAWAACGVADDWQRAALRDDSEGRAANDRLDAAMRLFQFANGFDEGVGVSAFIDQVRAMQIEADSLAHIGPSEDAVTLTTPAGSAGRRWSQVWIPAVQQGTWPNMTPRNTLFGADVMADIVLHGRDSGDDARMQSVLCGEKRGFLVALTRATRRVHLSAVRNDDLTPSDFLYAYLPERFWYDDGDRAVPYRSVGEEGGHHGLELDARGLIAAARMALVVDPDDEDAAKALAVLAAHGHEDADPSHWPFLYMSDDAAAGDSPERDAVVSGDDLETTGQVGVDGSTDSGAPEVRLSPSAVDGIWNCPVCWLLDAKFSGPRAGGVDTGFGSLIHAVAEQASLAGLDLPDGTVSPERRIAEVTEWMIGRYAQLRPDPDAVTNVRERYRLLRKERNVPVIMRHIAEYFVNSNTENYASTKTAKVDVGRLQRAECERSFTATFTMDDLRGLYNAIPGSVPMGADDFYAMMGLLVGGWPDGMRPDLSITLSGRIDRLEYRDRNDGKETVIRLVDYKTGAKRTLIDMFNDLQLVCYQLGLRFDPGFAAGGDSGIGVSQSGLFFVRDANAPSYYKVAESGYQPALFVNGHVNDEPFVPRPQLKRFSQCLDLPDPPMVRPDDISEKAWGRMRADAGTQTRWALTMMARVCYAAGAVVSERLVAEPSRGHRQYCRYKAVCPACADGLTTVMEV